MTIQVRSDAGGTYGAIQVAGTDRLTIDTNGNVTCTGMPVNQGPFTFRNRVLNGNMAIDQRNNGVSQTIGSNQFVYTLDRHIVSCIGTNAITAQRTGSVGAYSLTITGAGGITGVAWVQRVESLNVYDLAGQTVTLSAVLSCTQATPISLQLYIPSVADNYSSTTLSTIQTFYITSTPTRYSITFTLPTGATNGVQLQLLTSALTSGAFTITNVQLEGGSSATVFEQRPYSLEVMMCQRYFYTINTNTGAGNGQMSNDGISLNGGVGAICAVRHPVPMRTSPTITAINPTFATINAGGSGYTVTAINSDIPSPFISTFNAAATGTGTAGFKSRVYRTSSSASFPALQFSAEI